MPSSAAIAQALALGSDPGAVMAELFGKGVGVSKGKGGLMHLFDVEHGVYGGYGIGGGHLTLTWTTAARQPPTSRSAN